MKVILDCDNTFFTPNRDIDDGLALLYLLGCPEVEVIAITGTYGNGTIEQVNEDTHRLLAVLKRTDIPYYRGGARAGDIVSPASEALVRLVKQAPGEISLLATGSLTNLYGASQQWPDFLPALKQVVLMGGKTAPLQFKKQEMAELNFSCDPVASDYVLTHAPRLQIMTGNHCLALPFTQAHYERHFGRYRTQAVVQLIEHYSSDWFRDNATVYGIDGFYNWDTLVACVLVHPEFFQVEVLPTTLSVAALQSGWLVDRAIATTKPAVTLSLPMVAAADGLRDHIYRTWLNVTI